MSRVCALREVLLTFGRYEMLERRAAVALFHYVSIWKGNSGILFRVPELSGSSRFTASMDAFFLSVGFPKILRVTTDQRVTRRGLHSTVRKIILSKRRLRKL
jgi:hypothetical protein